MRTRDALLAAVLDAAPLLILDARGRIVVATAAAAELFAAAGDDLQDRAVEDLIPGFEPRAALARDQTAWTGRDRAGRALALQVAVSRPPAAAAAQDWTALWLGQLPAAQAAEAHSRDLQDQLARVWRINSLGEMAASLAHELNQPLAAAAAHLHTAQTNLARQALPDDEAGRNLDLAKSQLLRAGAIVRRVREQLTPEIGAFGVERVSEMIADMASLLALLERDGAVTLELEVPPHDDAVRADRIQFQQAVVNLVRNAVEAVSGQARRHVRLSGGPLDQDRYEIRIEDNGPGVAPAQVDAIFRPLMSTKRTGMGLGLSVTRKIVETHGGVLTVGPSPLGGAAFRFTLARAAPTEAAA